MILFNFCKSLGTNCFPYFIEKARARSNNLPKVTKLVKEPEFELKEFDCNACDFNHYMLLPFLTTFEIKSELKPIFKY